jgi:hypothetical protein
MWRTVYILPTHLTFDRVRSPLIMYGEEEWLMLAGAPLTRVRDLDSSLQRTLPSSVQPRIRTSSAEPAPVEASRPRSHDRQDLLLDSIRAAIFEPVWVTYHQCFI